MSKKAVTALIAAAVLIMVLLCVYFFAFKQVVFVTDEAWNLLEPRSEMRTLRLALALKGYRMTTVDFDIFKDKYPFYSSSALWVLSPLSSAAAAAERLPLSASTQALVAALEGQEGYDGFDIVLKGESVEISEDAVDYRYSAVREGKVWCPGLKTSILPLLSLDKESLSMRRGFLSYEYR